ncbi:MAG: hypothetical protein WC937_02715 [Candidatus Omnitrophota bacterium]|jgi:hypothetical protein|nr:hypothetical protein [Candidatus Omnitrophota bacterium]
MKNRFVAGQSVLEYVIILSIVAIALAAMSIYFRRGIQSVVKIAADEVGNQEDAEDINPTTGVKTSSEINRQTQATRRERILKGGSRASDTNTTIISTGISSSVETQEK